jgi:hypothetical protein
MLIQDQVTVFQWLSFIKYGGLRLARWVTLQHYFGTTLPKVAHPWFRRRQYEHNPQYTRYYDCSYLFEIINRWEV